jgi:hypothetical protein
MDGYRYMIERNRLMQNLEENLKKLAGLPEQQREAETRRLRVEFDRRLTELYTQVASEFPGERKKKARAMTDPH